MRSCRAFRMRYTVFASKKTVALIAVFYTFLWGSAFPLVKLCMDGFGITDNMSKCLVAGIRFTVSGAAITVFCLCRQPKVALLPKKELYPVFLYGILGTAMQYAFTYIGLSNVDGAKGAIFDQLCVFLIILASGLFLKNDKLTPSKLLGCGLGFVGTLFVSTEKMSLTFSAGGEGMMILAALCQTGAYLVATVSAGKLSAVRLVGFGQLFGGAVLTLFAFAAGGRIPQFTMQGAGCLLMLSAISAIAYILSLIPLKYFPASEVSVFNLLITVFGVVMSGIVLGESIFRLNYLIALVLIALGILAVNRKQGNGA